MPEERRGRRPRPGDKGRRVRSFEGSGRLWSNWTRCRRSTSMGLENDSDFVFRSTCVFFSSFWSIFQIFCTLVSTLLLYDCKTAKTVCYHTWLGLVGLGRLGWKEWRMTFFVSRGVLLLVEVGEWTLQWEEPGVISRCVIISPWGCSAAKWGPHRARPRVYLLMTFFCFRP